MKTLLIIALFLLNSFADKTIDNNLKLANEVIEKVKNFEVLDKETAINFEQFYREIKASSYYEMSPKILKESLYSSVLKATNDPYANIDFVRNYDFHNSIEGKLKGFGFVFRLRKSTPYDELFISSIKSGSFAENSGLRVGDRLLEIDGHKLIGSPKILDGILEVNQKDDFKFLVKRDDKELELELTRGSFSEIPVVSKELEDNIYYIRLNTFSKLSSEKFIEEIKKVEKKNFSKLILDLRNNDGGYMQASYDIISLFTDKKQIAYLQGKPDLQGGVPRTLGIKSNETIKDIVVLVNSATMSAAELTADCLRKHSNATIIGKKSFGKGVMQKIFDVNKVGSLRLTVGEFMAVKGEGFDGIGIKPDIEIDKEFPIPYEDSALKEAVNVLKKK